MNKQKKICNIKKKREKKHQVVGGRELEMLGRKGEREEVRGPEVQIATKWYLTDRRFLKD